MPATKMPFHVRDWPGPVAEREKHQRYLAALDAGKARIQILEQQPAPDSEAAVESLLTTGTIELALPNAEELARLRGIVRDLEAKCRHQEEQVRRAEQEAAEQIRAEFAEQFDEQVISVLAAVSDLSRAMTAVSKAQRKLTERGAAMPAERFVGAMANPENQTLFTLPPLQVAGQTFKKYFQAKRQQFPRLAPQINEILEGLEHAD